MEEHESKTTGGVVLTRNAPGPSHELAGAAGELVAMAKRCAIVDRASLGKAASLLRKLKEGIAALEDQRTQFTKPMLDHKGFIDTKFKAFTEPLGEAVDIVTEKLLAYAADEGIEPGHDPIRGEYGTATIRAKKPTVEVVDEAQVPDEFFKREVDTKALLAAYKDGTTEIPGVTFAVERSVTST